MQKNKSNKSWDEFLPRATLPSWDAGSVIIAGERIVPHFQPIIGLTSGQIVGYECLARSFSAGDSSGGSSGGSSDISPRSFGHFFSDPKISGSFQLEVDRALRYQALDYFSKHPDSGYITLNISPNWIERILETHTIPTLEMIEETGIDPKRVVIEITETKGDLDKLKEMVDLYHQAGLMVAVDDFGAGYSQMDRIEALEPDIVKLDMRLFKQASRGGKSADVALSISSIANRVGCHIVCEGVETEEEFHFGIECGSNHVQGFIFHKALADTLSANSTVDKVRALQKSYLKEKSIKLVRASEQKEKIKKVVLDIRENYINGEPLKINNKIMHSDIIRYYVCDYTGNQITPHYEVSTSEFFEDYESHGMNVSHRPYFPAFIATNNSSDQIFTVSEVYRDVKSHQLCRTYAIHLDINKILLVDALVEDEIIFAKE